MLGLRHFQLQDQLPLHVAAEFAWIAAIMSSIDCPASVPNRVHANASGSGMYFSLGISDYSCTTNRRQDIVQVQHFAQIMGFAQSGLVAGQA